MTIEERVEKVEMELARAKRRNRLLLAGVLLAVVLLAVGATTPGVASREDVVKAKQFILVDVNDKTRAELSVTAMGPVLGLFDKKGIARAILSVPEDGPGLSLSNENGKIRAILSVPEDGPMLYLYDESGKAHTGLVMFKDGSSLNLSDKNGKTRATLGRSQTTTPDGKTITYPESSLLLFDPNGNVIWMAPP
jgi:hypothetical protein